MANYTIPENPEYIEEIRKIERTDPVNADEIVNPLIQLLIDNIHCVKLKADLVDILQRLLDNQQLEITGKANTVHKHSAADITSGTLSLARGGTNSTDGTAPYATTLKTARTIDGVSFNGGANITHYASCSTPAATAAKVVTLSNFTLAAGAVVTVRFTYANTAANPTLNVNGTGAKPIHAQNAALANNYYWSAYDIVTFVYSGSYWFVVGAPLGALLKAGGTMTGILYAQSNTSYATAQVRNIAASTTDLTAGTSSLNNGTIYLVYE